MFQHSTENGSRPHRHLLYIDEQGAISVGEANKHTHPIEVFQESVIDPMTLMETPVGAPVTFLAEVDGHTHDLAGELFIKEKKGKKRPDEDVCREMRELFESAKKHEENPRKAAKESYDFYHGDQWDESTKSELAAKRRACLTINHIAGAVDSLSGYLRQNRTDIKFWPVEDGDAVVADICTAIVKNICERSEFEHVEVEVFEDEVIAGRGCFHPYFDYDDNPEGEIKIERWEWDEVYFGPHNKPDGSDAEHSHKVKWFSKDQLKNQYPDKADDIQADMDAETTDDLTPHLRVEGRQYELGSGARQPLGPEYVNTRKKEFLVIESERKEYQRIPVIFDVLRDEYTNADGWSSKDISAAKSLGFEVVYQPIHKMKIVKYSGNVVLESSIEDLREFSIIPVYAKKRKDKWYGKVLSAIDPQRELNKVRSQGVDILNKSVSHGWFWDQQTFSTPQQRRTFQDNINAPGFSLEVADTSKLPAKVDSEPLPSGLAAAQQAAKAEVREILNVTPEVLNSSSASGVAIIEGKRMALLGSEYLFDNLSMAKKRLGKRLVQMIQQVYTPERMVRILMTMNQRRPVSINGMPITEETADQFRKLLSTSDLTKFDVVVGEAQSSPNKQTSDFSVLLEIGRVTGGQAVPPELLVEAAPLSEDKKQRALQYLQQQKESAAQAEQAKQQTEIQKSMPDEVKLAQARQQQMQNMQQVPRS